MALFNWGVLLCELYAGSKIELMRTQKEAEIFVRGRVYTKKEFL